MIEIAAARFSIARERYALASQLATAHGDQMTRLWAQFFQGAIDLYTGDLPSAERNMMACLNVWQSQDFKRGIAWSLNWLSDIVRQSGRLHEAATFAREGLQISSTTHDRPGIARALRELGALAFERQDLDEANYLLTESCSTFRSMGSPWVYGRSLALLVQLEVQQQRYAEARAGCAELLRLIPDGVLILLPDAAYGLALLQIAHGHEQEALALLIALADTPAEYATLVRIAQVRVELERRLDTTQRSAAQVLAHTRQLLPWLEELCA
jgi:tetratricopeptide (TPR) repeat protein